MKSEKLNLLRQLTKFRRFLDLFHAKETRLNDELAQLLVRAKDEENIYKSTLIPEMISATHGKLAKIRDNQRVVLSKLQEIEIAIKENEKKELQIAHEQTRLREHNLLVQMSGTMIKQSKSLKSTWPHQFLGNGYLGGAPGLGKRR